MSALADEFGPLLRQELDRLSEHRAAWRVTGDVASLRIVAHDLRGLGAVYGVPLTGRIAASLERLLLADAGPAALVNAHVDAILAVVREGAAAATHPRGAALASALEAAVELFDRPPAPQAA